MKIFAGLAVCFVALPTVCLAEEAPLHPVHVARMLPKPAGRADYYPGPALESEINGGATIKCKVVETGRLTDCVVVTEAPKGYDFGKAAIAIAEDRVVADTSQDAPGDWVLWTFNFSLN